MSLINQMLKDIEKRARPNTSVSITSFNSLPARHETKKRSLFFILIGITLICLIAGIFFFFSKEKRTSLPVTVKKGPATLQQLGATIIALPSIAMLKKVGFENEHLTPTILKGITLEIADKKTSLRFLLSQKALYRVNYHKAHDRLIIYLDRARLMNSLPVINYENSAIRNMQIFNMPNGDLKIILALFPAVEVQLLQLNEKGKFPELQLQLLLPYPPDSSASTTEKIEQPSTTSPTGPMKKLVVNMMLNDEYQKAANLAALGNNEQAIQSLKILITRNPAYIPARELLVNLLLQKGDKFNADKYLTLGLHLYPNYIPFIELHGRMLSDNGKIKEALGYLQRISPPIANHPNYYTLMAALYQRQGDFAMAAKVYEQLLRVNSSKAVWWVGLGIAYEAMDKPSEALQAYARANTGEGLTPELSSYVNNRIESV